MMHLKMVKYKLILGFHNALTDSKIYTDYSGVCNNQNKKFRGRVSVMLCPNYER